MALFGELFIGMHENLSNLFWKDREKVLDEYQVNSYYEDDEYCADIESIFYLADFFITGMEMVEKLKNEMNKFDDIDKTVEYANYIHFIDENEQYDNYFFSDINKNDYDYDYDNKRMLQPVKAGQLVDESAYGLEIIDDEE